MEDKGRERRDESLRALVRHLHDSYIPRRRKWMVLFPEGGFLRKRRDTSQKFALKNNLPVLQHVSLPRVGAMHTIVDVALTAAPRRIQRIKPAATPHRGSAPPDDTTSQPASPTDGTVAARTRPYQPHNTELPQRQCALHLCMHARLSHQRSLPTRLLRRSAKPLIVGCAASTVLLDLIPARLPTVGVRLSSQCHELCSSDLNWVLDITIAYPEGKPLDLGAIVTGYRPPCKTLLFYRLYPCKEVPPVSDCCDTNILNTTARGSCHREHPRLCCSSP
ncbi:uncharacterized protein GBIM_11175 [Gryllus bimaculatus]|nr:uncharacterized protein GBIM_11175 [Gryllus bimaculatus]